MKHGAYILFSENSSKEEKSCFLDKLEKLLNEVFNIEERPHYPNYSEFAFFGEFCTCVEMLDFARCAFDGENTVININGFSTESDGNQNMEINVIIVVGVIFEVAVYFNENTSVKSLCELNKRLTPYRISIKLM